MARMTHAPEPPFPPAATVSLASIQREYLEDLKCRVSPSHYKNVKARLDRLATALQLGDLHQLQPLQLIRYRNLQREKGASNRTANLVVDSFGAMLAWAVGCGLIPTKPLRQVRPGGREKNGAGGGDRTRDIQLGNWNLGGLENRAEALGCHRYQRCLNGESRQKAMEKLGRPPWLLQLRKMRIESNREHRPGRVLMQEFLSSQKN